MAEITEVSRAKGKYFKISPQKARLVIDLIRGQNVPKALGILKVTPKRACRPIEKVLKSAVANAKGKTTDVGCRQTVRLSRVCRFRSNKNVEADSSDIHAQGNENYAQARAHYHSLS